MTHLLSFFVVIILGSFSANAQPKNSVSKHVDPYRLPNNVRPVSYKLFLAPDLEKSFTFDGESEIVIHVIKKTRQIVLHACELEIKTATLIGPHKERIDATIGGLNTTYDFLYINLGKELVPRIKYTLKLSFKGELNEEGMGFYRVSYIDDSGISRWSASTNFEPISARRAFPCFDEPHAKAKFAISIKHHTDLNAISNMHAIGTEVDKTDSTHSITTFATTPKMSTYLVAFVVTDYQSLSNSDESFTIWTKPSILKRGKFFVEFAQKMLDELGRYTGIPYARHGFKKMDAVASFSPKRRDIAMENWGLVTFIETLLPIGENVGKVEGAYDMMHEFAHQWFGNLVTPKSWQFLWLSEGLATYFQYVLTDKIWPEWRLKDLQVIQCLQEKAFPLDSRYFARAMDSPVSSPSEIEEKFNAVSYCKAASLLRSIAHIVGDDKFQQALMKYLEKRKFRTASPPDLFKEFVKVFPTIQGLRAKPMHILNNWATTPGFPVINVTRNYKRNTVKITQERFLDQPDDSLNSTYYVPINYATQGERNFNDTSVTIWLDKNKSFTEIHGNFKKNEWVIFNKQQFGYYRVNYDEKNWRMISDFLQSESYTDVHVINRAQIVDDALKLAQTNQLRWDVALNVLQFLKQEVDPVPWYPAFSGFVFLQHHLAGTDFDKSFKEYTSQLVETVLKNVTLNESDEDDEMRKEFRINIVNLACDMGSETCRNEALQKVRKWVKDTSNNRLPRKLVDSLLCASVRNADRPTWNTYFATYLAGGANEFVEGLACTSDANILKDYLSKTIDNQFLKFAHCNRVFKSAIAQSERGVDVVSDFLIANAHQIFQQPQSCVGQLQRHIRFLGQMISTEAQLRKLNSTTGELGELFSADANEEGRAKLDWLNSRRAQFAEFFNH